MRLLSLIVALIVPLLAGSQTVAATRKQPASKSAGKKISSQKSKNAGLRARGKTVRSAKAGKTSKKRGSKVAAQPRRSVPPRQGAPTSERYREIQVALNQKGYYNGAMDGAWDADSVAALKKFQTEQNLNPDGKLGSLSIIALGLGPKREPITQFDTKPERPGAPYSAPR